MKEVQWIDPDFLAPKDAWDRLSMKEKAAMMKVAVQNGITNLSDIRAKYNEFAEGGPVDTDWGYNSWKRQVAEHMGIRPDEDNTYDYEAYFNKYPEEAWKMLKGDPTAHFSDEFKTVYHPTFSSKSIGNDGSIYSGIRNPKTNPQGLAGGTWSPDYNTFTMSPDGYRGPVSMDDRKWYLENAEDNGVVLREADGSLPLYDGIPWGGVLPNVTVYGNKHAEGGNLFRGGGGIFGLMPALSFSGIDWDKAAEKVKNLYQYSKSYLKHKLEGDGEGEVIDLSKKKVSRIKKNTNNVTSILTNDFVERNNNMVRQKKDFINTTDTLLGDKKIPLSKISTFYGIEDGRLKAGPLSIFNDTTTVIPNRAKSIGKIKEYYPGKPSSKEALAKRREAIDKEITEYNSSKGYEPDWLSKMLPFIPGARPREVLHHNLIKEEGNNRVGRLRARKRYDDILRSMGDKYSYLYDGEPARVITENNDTIIGYELNASPKTLFADENGNAVFVAQPRQHAEELNSYLQEHPMYPIMVDNGRYAAYQTSFPNAEIYGGLNSPDNMFILGTTKALGGPIVEAANTFRGGGYKPSASVKKRISTWEGAAMAGAKDPLSGKWGKNRSFEAEASSFYAALPASIREQVLSNPELADNLFSYSYNVGAGNFKKRVVPALERYYSGIGSAEEIASSMWASGDKKLRGLRNRRAVERNGVLNALTPSMPVDNTFVYNPYFLQEQNTTMLPQVVPDEDAYVSMHEVSPEEIKAQKLQESFDNINRFNRTMEMLGNNLRIPTFHPTTGNDILDLLWSTRGNDSPLLQMADEYARGGRIHIKEKNRGKFTRLKERTGKSASWFKAHGTPAQKKMAVFALNSKKWKHGLGGNLFSGEEDHSNQMNIGLNATNGWQPYTLGDIVANGERVARQRKALQDTFLNFPVESNDATSVTNGRPQNIHLEEKAVRGGTANAAWEKEHPGLAQLGYAASAIPFAVASAPILGAAAETGAGQAVTAGLGWLGDAAVSSPLFTNAASRALGTSTLLPWLDAGMTAGFGAHGIQEALEGNSTPMTALEVAPLGRLVKPITKEAALAVENYRYPLGRPQVPKNFINIKPKSVEVNNLSWAQSLPGRKDYSLTRVEPYSGYTPTTQSAENSNFVKDVMEGFSWGKNRYFPQPSEVRNFDVGLLNGETLGSGAEATVIRDPNDVGKVLKFNRNLFSDTKEGIIDGATKYVEARNRVPYNLPLSVEGYWEGTSGFYPVFGQKKIVPLTSETAIPYNSKIRDFNGSVNGTFMYFPGKHRPNRILGENGITETQDLKVENLGVLDDGSIIGTDLATPSIDMPAAEWATGRIAPEITAENAASMTPEQWDAAYRAAYEAGDKAEGQRLWDLWFKQKAPNTKQTTPMFNASGESIFNEFNGGKTGLNWFSESEEYAANHGIPRAFYINEPDIYFGNVPAWIKGAPADKRYVNSLKKLGYTDEQIAQKVQEINEAADSTAPAAKSIGMGINNELVTKNNSTIKLADPFTLADDGSLIPLTKRADFNNPDIRYGLVPFGIGLTGYGLFNNQEALEGKIKKRKR